MQIGMIGLGRMGGNMAQRLRDNGHEVIGYDHSPDRRDVASLPELVERLAAPRAVWVMVPAGEPTRATITELSGLLSEGDIVVDGGNSHYLDDRHHAEELGARGIGFVDVGVSGGVWGRENGYALMAGGEAEHIDRVRPIFDALKPTGDFGFVHAGGVGAGHYTKMVHNGIEYGMMQSFAEGYELLAASDIVHDVPGTFRSWKEGTVIRSWLLDLLVRALDDDADLSAIKGYAEDSGEGRWTVQAAVDHAVPLPVITAALYARFASRQEESQAMKVVAALRNQFGGHAVAKEDPAG
ncbi:phosphogluconate dehydrogenase (NAD(+)-dependent, decarboxylating) [Allonocardiopsis opalescens]|uniref:6-phosphogluconate dehydrogenase (Decarboxylating) n=1 Tax=Allonocardiopsis opalescens TaxID=1144618 RepID=A0A2T0Q6X7_9ACTN|nr:decarboxylating 6-phosphogluconate dehydrogenase [Allonocardiopsis opalescens]PRX99577.1 6-phosphogluconate dehydrogenase (decarboxylating) [Allonocardiopsis opalescens]